MKERIVIEIKSLQSAIRVIADKRIKECEQQLKELEDDTKKSR